MDETLDKRLRAIVAAGWRSAVIGMLVFVATWLIFVAFLHLRPGWLIDLWGGELDWSTVQTVGIYFFGVLKLLWFVFLFGVLFVALLRLQLRRLA